MSLASSAGLFSHCLQVFRGHMKLLVFPLAMFATCVAAFALLLPMLFHVTAAQAWQGLWHPEAAQEQLGAIADGIWRLDLRFRSLLVAWLLLVSCVTFTNFAFYSQAINALNGRPVSVGRGYLLALSRLPSIAAWSLFSGTIGTLVAIVEKVFGIFAHLVLDSIVVSRVTGRRRLLELVVWLGVPWSVVGQFVVPVMINQPQVVNPVANVRIAVRILKRLWDECMEDALVIGRIGPSSIGYIVGAGTAAVLHLMAAVTHQYSLELWGLLPAFAIFCLTAAVNGVFRCGMYIYATEGVIPGPLDADLISRAWSVRLPGATASADAGAQRR